MHQRTGEYAALDYYVGQLPPLGLRLLQTLALCRKPPAREIFLHLVAHAYASGQPGSITIIMEERGPRLRLMFEDDAPPHNPTVMNGRFGMSFRMADHEKN